jgi:two-component system chemotaxis response regulator CheB
MTPKFTEYLATRINTLGVIPTTEAINGQEALPGHAYIAPGGMHMEVLRSGSKILIELNENPPENSCRPAVDVLFRSAANTFGSHVLGVVLTGMGYDGLKGSMDIVKAGGHIWAQDRESSVIWGMPGAVVNENLSDKVLSLSQIPNEILLQLQRK